MGATAFFETAKGKTVEEAFDTAVKDAKEVYGTCGNTGTIAEKEEFIIISKTTKTLEAAKKMANRMINNQDERIDGICGACGCIPLDTGEWFFFGWAHC